VTTFGLLYRLIGLEKSFAQSQNMLTHMVKAILKDFFLMVSKKERSLQVLPS